MSNTKGVNDVDARVQLYDEPEFPDDDLKPRDEPLTIFWDEDRTGERIGLNFDGVVVFCYAVDLRRALEAVEARSGGDY